MKEVLFFMIECDALNLSGNDQIFQNSFRL